MTNSRQLRRVIRLALAAVLLISLVPASAAALPDPDEIASQEEPEECSDPSEAINPLAEADWDEYKNCKAEEIEYNQRQQIANNLSQILDIKNQIKSLIP